MDVEELKLLVRLISATDENISEKLPADWRGSTNRNKTNTVLIQYQAGSTIESSSNVLIDNGIDLGPKYLIHQRVVDFVLDKSIDFAGVGE